MTKLITTPLQRRYPCTPRCMLSSNLLGEKHLLSSNKQWYIVVLSENYMELNGGFNALRDDMHKPLRKGCSDLMYSDARRGRGSRRSQEQRSICFAPSQDLPLVPLRDHRLNGADLYVVRVTKVGLGSAKPCNRCVYWCRWAGIRRIYHWDQGSSAFLCVKVNDYGTEGYETRADDLRRASPSRA